MKPRVAIIGAGWSGLAAAVELAGQARVTVFEAGRSPGGRARQVRAEPLALDNGQHILLGAYRECLRLMQRVGVDLDTSLLRLPLAWFQLDGMSMPVKQWRLSVHPVRGKAPCCTCWVGWISPPVVRWR